MVGTMGKGIEPETATERAGLIVVELMNGEELTTRQVAEVANMSMWGAWALMIRLCRVLPIEYSESRWRILSPRQ
jgi:hypothetical protein